MSHPNPRTPHEMDVYIFPGDHPMMAYDHFVIPGQGLDWNIFCHFVWCLLIGILSMAYSPYNWVV